MPSAAFSLDVGSGLKNCEKTFLRRQKLFATLLQYNKKYAILYAYLNNRISILSRVVEGLAL